MPEFTDHTPQRPFTRARRRRKRMVVALSAVLATWLLTGATPTSGSDEGAESGGVFGFGVSRVTKAARSLGENENLRKVFSEENTRAAADSARELLDDLGETASDTIDSFTRLRERYEQETEKVYRKLADNGEKQLDNAPKKLKPSNNPYPLSKEEIEQSVADLLKRRDVGTPAEQQTAINELNVFRFLCGVAPNVVYSREFGRKAQMAAEVCHKRRRIAHSLGDYTDCCNLFSGMNGAMRTTVTGYMDDPGNNNRTARGHRMWCLNPTMGKCGFGKHEGYQAMYVMDFSSTHVVTEPYSYPGRGYFPARYLHGNGWSYYAAPNSGVGKTYRVSMWKLEGSITQKPESKDLRRSISIKRVYSNGNYVVFEPDYSKMTLQDGVPHGTYWVRIISGRLEDEYVVDLY